MRGEARQVLEVLQHARMVSRRETGIPQPASAAQAGGSLPVPAPAGIAGRGQSSDRKDSLGCRLAAWANTWGDSKSDTILDALIVEAREVGWLP